MMNINDHLGGGNNFSSLFMANTCRESGDHGAVRGATPRGARRGRTRHASTSLPRRRQMNSWDRQPFATQIRSGGGAASYAPALTDTHHSFIIANYGSSQGFDNDDGSNYFRTHHNFFYQAGASANRPRAACVANGRVPRVGRMTPPPADVRPRVLTHRRARRAQARLRRT